MLTLLMFTILTESRDSRPNILMMVVDDLRPRFGSIYNDTEVLTPNIDKHFGADGACFCEGGSSSAFDELQPTERCVCSSVHASSWYI